MNNKSFTVSLIILIFISFFTPLNANDLDFGSVSLQIDRLPTQTLAIQRALLYRNVNIEYDSTVLVQSEKSADVLFYPQLNKGNQNVLRLIIGETGESNENFIDMFFNIGDTLPDSIVWNDQENRVYMAYNGIAQAIKPQSHNIDGTIHISSGDKDERVAGNLKLNFDMRLFAEDQLPRNFKIEGDFDVPVGEYRSSSLGSAAKEEEMKKKYRKNLYLAIIGGVLLVVLFGLR